MFGRGIIGKLCNDANRTRLSIPSTGTDAPRVGAERSAAANVFPYFRPGRSVSPLASPPRGSSYPTQFVHLTVLFGVIYVASTYIRALHRLTRSTAALYAFPLQLPPRPSPPRWGHGAGNPRVSRCGSLDVWSMARFGTGGEGTHKSPRALSSPSPSANPVGTDVGDASPPPK